MSERYDSKVHEVVEIRDADDTEANELILCIDGLVRTKAEKEHDQKFSSRGSQVIVRRKPEPVRDLAWAVAEMVRNPGREYENGIDSYKARYNEIGCFEFWGHAPRWKSDNCVFSVNSRESTDWRPVPAAPAEGSAEWLTQQPDGTCVMDKVRERALNQCLEMVTDINSKLRELVKVLDAKAAS
jgi:hypothetical protein